MKTDLFPEAKGDSPRLKWMRDWNLHTIENKHVQPGDEDEFSGEPLFRWCAYTGQPRFPRADAGYGNTEDEAIASWARLHGRRLWNEESFEVGQ